MRISDWSSDVCSSDLRDAGVGDRARAHRAGLQRHIEVAAVEALVAELRGGGANRDDFGVRGRIVRFARAVVAFGDGLSVLDYDRAARHPAPFRRVSRAIVRAEFGVAPGSEEVCHSVTTPEVSSSL